MEKIKIGISGSHSTGKSTFIRSLTNFLDDKSIEYKVVSDLASICPLPILREHTVESTLWIGSTGISREIEAEYNSRVVIVDRSIIDCWVYFNAVCKGKYPEDNSKLATLRNMISNWLPTYDFIYQTVIDETIKIEDNKGRDLDNDYRKLIGDEMTLAASYFNFSPRPLTTENKTEELDFIIDKITSL